MSAKNAHQKAQKIKLLILDVDGVLTSGTIYYGNQGIELRGFHIQDGLGIKLLQKTGVMVAIISGKKSEAVMQRIQELQIKHFYLGHEEKLPAYEALKNKLNLQDEHIAYMGDDWPDLPLLLRAELAITVPDAPQVVKDKADLVTKLAGGQGAVREACEFIMHAQQQYDSLLKPYLNHDI